MSGGVDLHRRAIPGTICRAMPSGFVPRLRRVALLAALAAALAGDYWNAYWIESGFGRAEASVTHSLRPFDWLSGAAPAPLMAARADTPDFRVVTYNLHSGLGPRWRLFAPRHEVERNLRAIAQRIAGATEAAAPVDVVALNEVDFNSRRSGWLDQAAFLAAELQRLTGYTYYVVRGETWHRDLPGLEVRFGNVALLRHPVLAVECCTLGGRCKEESAAGYDSAGRLFGSEPRGVLRVRIEFHDRPLGLLITHLEAFAMAQREVQAAEVMGRHVRRGETTLLLGDMNTVEGTMTRRQSLPATDRTHAILTGGALVDARIAVAARTGAGDISAWATYPAHAPAWPLDGIFATPDLAPLAVRVIGGDESDHRGLFVHYAWLTADATEAHSRWHDAVRRRRAAPVQACDSPASDTKQARYIGWLKSGTNPLGMIGNGGSPPAETFPP